MDLKAAASLFRVACAGIWGSVHIDVEVVDDPPPAGGALAALRFDHGDVEAHGRELVRHASLYVLALSASFHELSSSQQLLCLMHEAIHVGYPEHDDNFAAVAAAVGAPLTEGELLGRFVVESRAPGQRWHRIRSCPTLEEAQAAVERLRLQHGLVMKYRVVA